MFIFTNIVNKLESFKNKVYRMSKQGAISGQWVEGGNKIECTLPLILFKEDNCFISYCPALDLNGYGTNELEANKSFEEVLSEYFRYTLHKKTLAGDLKKMGWTIRKNMKKCPIPPTMDKLLETNEDFKRIFNNNDFHKTNRIFNIPALA
jgi:Zn-finger protein